MPGIANAKDATERNKQLHKWIDQYGTITKTEDYVIEDSTKYSRFVNLDWLEDNNLFDKKPIAKFQRIKDARRSKKLNYYAIPYGRPLNNPFFEREKAYSNIKWDDQGFRILTLFRLWNMIEYCFPYTDYTDTPWKGLLGDFIPRFVFPENKVDYELALLELAAKINDSHGYMMIPYNNLAETAMAPKYKRNKAAVELTLSAEGYIVVKSSENNLLDRGDIILSIEGRDVYEIIEEMEPYVIASNRNGLIRNVLPYLLSSDLELLNVEVLRDGERLPVEVKFWGHGKQKTGIKHWGKYDLESKGIIHVDNQKSAETNRNIVENNMNSKGLIIDMRRYPRNNNMNLLSPLLIIKNILWVSENVKSYPGNYCVMYGYNNDYEKDKKPDYEGRIVILVDEYTQSAGETWSMLFQASPNSVVVGRQTAGANGNICMVYMPGGAEFTYSQLGAYYPNWEILQREGVKIDIPVSPTVEDIRQGRDVWIEKSIEVIENNSTIY